MRTISLSFSYFPQISGKGGWRVETLSIQVEKFLFKFKIAQVLLYLKSFRDLILSMLLSKIFLEIFI